MTTTDTTAYYAAYSNRGGKRVHATATQADSPLATLDAVCGVGVHTRRKAGDFGSTAFDGQRCHLCVQITGIGQTEADDRPDPATRIVRLFGRLPAVSHLPHHDDLDMHDIADHLEALVQWFESNRDRNERRDTELEEHRSLMRGLRSFVSAVMEFDK